MFLLEDYSWGVGLEVGLAKNKPARMDIGLFMRVCSIRLIMFPNSLIVSALINANKIVNENLNVREIENVSKDDSIEKNHKIHKKQQRKIGNNLLSEQEES